MQNVLFTLFAIENVFVPLSLIKRISPGSISRSNVALIISRPQVSDEMTKPSSFFPNTRGRIPLGSLIAKISSL
jgi:hypothetical protein